ncbi:MAG: glycosyltransferase [Gammaproteobacteria bacterium]|nr:glycosyltransferase [Gammaproteobacteria bacterium]MCW8922095.1 glycosyltransferase [Gammaproteobacteria bacterium]
MSNDLGFIKSSIIISVYKDVESLNLILRSLKAQTVDNFEVIVSEDGESSEIKSYITQQEHFKSIKHLTQKDNGFRKNRALNRAILSSSSNHLILIDGDCLPHSNFVKSHQKYIKPGIACTGRRVELDENTSRKIRCEKISLSQLNNPIWYILNMLSFIRNKTNDYPLGLPLSILQPFTENRKIGLLGCNMSVHKEDIFKINGFNEDYKMAGIGEDSDIEWRLKKININIKNIKFSAKQYHLYHKRGYSQSDGNLAIMRETQSENRFYCKKGINQRKYEFR